MNAAYSFEISCQHLLGTNKLMFCFSCIFFLFSLLFWYLYFYHLCMLGFIGGMLLGRTLSILLTMTIGTSMAARQGPTAMAAHQICLQVWLAVSLLADALAVSAQVCMLRSGSHLAVKIGFPELCWSTILQAEPANF
jgi:Na+-driven multidrug efflux pump